MRKSRLVARVLLIILLVGMFTLRSEAGNRFNVFVYQDYAHPSDSINNIDEFYRDLDDFGCRYLYSLEAEQAAARAKDTSGNPLSYKIFSSYFYQPMYLTADSTLELYEDLVQAYDLLMLSTNTDLPKGYRSETNATEYRSGENIISSTAYDLSLDRDVVEAKTSSHSAGLLHARFDAGVFTYPPRFAGVEDSLYFEANLKISNTAGDSATIVAQLIVENFSGAWNGAYGCDWTGADDTSKYAVQIYNDTLAIVGTSSGLDTVRVLDSHTARLQQEYCGSVATFTGAEYDNRFLCYVNPLDASDTVCSVPFRFISDIHRGDFSNTSAYHSFSIRWMRHPATFSSYAFKVKWLDVEDMFLDMLHVYNQRGQRFTELVNDSLGVLTSNIEGWYTGSRLDAKDTEGFGLWDEPLGAEFPAMQNFQTVLDNLSSGYPKEQFTTLGAYNVGTDGTIRSDYIASYREYVSRPYFTVDFYQNSCRLSNSSDVSFTPTTGAYNFQRSLEYVDTLGVEQGLIDHLEIIRDEIDKLELSGKPTDVWITLPTFHAVGDKDTQNRWVKSDRMLTGEEYWATINTCLAYGVRGIGYWTYVTVGGCESTPPYECDVVLQPNSIVEQLLDTPDLLSVDLADVNDDLIAGADACSCFTTARPYKFSGLTDRDANNEAQPEPIWDTLRTINMYLDSMAGFFLNSEWKSAGRWTDDLGQLSGSFIDSIRSTRSFTMDSAFLQVGFFEDTLEDQWAYIVNRRSQNGQSGSVDSQTVSIFMGGEGVYEVRDYYQQDVDTMWDSAGVVRLEKFLQPGAAVLISKRPLRESWSGSISQYMTWPQYSTINVTGDITVDSATTLTIQSDLVSMASFADAESTYVENRVNIIVKGELQVQGTEANPVVMCADTTSDTAWSGITIYDGGELSLSDVQIKNADCCIRLMLGGELTLDDVTLADAYAGIQLDSTVIDTINNTTFENCTSYGIEWKADSGRVEDCTFSATSGTSVGYGIKASYVDSGSVISNCDFYDIKYPIDLFKSSPAISDCYFTTSNFFLGGTAIAASDTSGPSVLDTKIANCTYGITLGTQAWTYVNDSRFYSDSLYISYGGIDTVPFMNTAIKGHALGATSCKVRHTCFGRTEYAHINKGATAFNLGMRSDTGYNYFSGHQTSGDKPVMVPTYAIYDSQKRAVWANGNCWDAPGADDDWLYSNVDSSSAFSVLPYSCWDAQQGQKTAAPQSEVTLPLSFEVSQNYPNPFNPTTTISFTLPNAVHVELVVFNVLGQVVKTLVDEEMGAGTHEIVWDGRSESGKSVSTGVYLYRIKAGEYEVSRKMMLIK